ncbi:type IV toxin-antitoxin system AbiEi family antitoxin domain-containing protein [Nocardioides sp. NPDC047086]|uniref:type IV toxin-antitoxin system AbiEi family antitoxin domain-containing protein n=1 Tax=Nocardioides sp. NPDC047086 TaxID=3154810 RepID=UPI0033E82A4A
MDELDLAVERAGFFTTQHAKAAGYADREITKMVRRREWHRIRRGAYAPAAVWAELDDVGRHRVRSSAVLHALGPKVALSHASGVVRHDIDLWRVPLDRVHVTRLDGGPGRIEGDVVHHEGFTGHDDIIEVEGQQVVRPERCVLETASRIDTEAAWCLLDSGLRSKRFNREQLDAAYSIMEHWPFMRRVGTVLPYADRRSGSVGESRGTAMFKRYGVPRPQLQYEVRRPDGTLAGITDWAWPQYGLLGEFDGKIKYGRLLEPGQNAGDVVFEEKRREDELRELTRSVMIRFIWSDYDRPAESIERLFRAMRRAG